MLKITGLDKLQRQLEMRSVRLSAIGDKVAPYRENAMVASIVPQLKAKYRAAILERAKEGRT